MIDCYFLGVCRGSALDRDTNNFTLFQLIEEVQVPEAAIGTALPFELHFYIAVTGDSLNGRADFQILWKDQNGGEDVRGANVFPIDLSHPRVRTRTGAVQLPPRPGHFRIYLEWRMAGAESWTRSFASWPFVLSIADEPPHSPSAPPVAPRPPV